MDEEKQQPEPEQAAPDVKASVADRAAKKREELRNGRRASQTVSSDVENAGNPGQDAGNSNSPVRGNLKILRGESSGVEPGDRRSDSAERGIDKEPLRVGSADRRSGNSDERPNVDVQSESGSKRVIGRLEAEGPIPDRLPDAVEPVEPKRGRGRPRKEETSGEEKKGFLGFGGGGKSEKGVMSHAEAERLREPFLAALKDDCKYADEFLAWYSKDEHMPQIWSDLDDEDIETLGNVLLNRAQRSASTATFVRNVIDGHDYISTAILVVPRVIKSAQQVSKRPKQQKKAKAS